MIEFFEDMEETQWAIAGIIYIIILVITWKFMLPSKTDLTYFGMPLMTFYKVVITIVMLPVSILVVKMMGD